MKTKSVLGWFGSDATVAEQLGAKFNACRHVTIPFCGGLGILPYLTATHVLANDLYSRAIEFYDCLQSGDRDTLIKRCRNTLCHVAELERARKVLDGLAGWWNYEHCWAFWVVCWLGQKGKGGTGDEGKTFSFRRDAGGGSNASRLCAAADDLDAWAEEFKRCEFLCRDFRLVLAGIGKRGGPKDKPDCGYYIDGPWFGSGDAYAHQFKMADHVELADLLHRFKESPIVIRYGDDPALRDLYYTNSWNWETVDSKNQANNKVQEVWISRRAA